MVPCQVGVGGVLLWGALVHPGCRPAALPQQVAGLIMCLACCQLSAPGLSHRAVRCHCHIRCTTPVSSLPLVCSGRGHILGFNSGAGLAGEDAEAIVEAVTEEIGEFLLLRNALLERQLQETLEDLYRVQALRDQAARYNAQQYLQLREAQRELAALRAANRAVQLTPDAEALQEVEARVSRAEADRDAAKEEQLMSKVRPAGVVRLCLQALH